MDFLAQVLREQFRYSEKDWALISEAIEAAGGASTAEVRRNLEYRVDWYLSAGTSQGSKLEIETFRGRLRRFVGAVDDIRMYLPTSANGQLDRMVQTLEAQFAEDERTCMGARPKTLQHDLCWAWAYELVGTLSKSMRQTAGDLPGRTKMEARGPLVRFLVAASRPVKGHAVDNKGAESSIKTCNRLVNQGHWPPLRKLAVTPAGT